MDEIPLSMEDSSGNKQPNMLEQQQFEVDVPEGVNLRLDECVVYANALEAPHDDVANNYEDQYWPKLESAIQQLLTLSPGEYVPISYEQMYSCVYKCVCKHFSERLYSDLLSHIGNHLQQTSVELHNVDPSVYIPKFNAAMNQYVQALGGIVPIFNYMNRFYVENKLHTDIKTELLRVFTVVVAENHIQKLLPMLDEAQTRPFSVMPQVMANIVKGLYSLKPEFAILNPNLFAKFIPNLFPPMNVSDLPEFIEETRQVQQKLLLSGFPRGDQSRKRSVSDSDISNPCNANHMN